MSELKEGKRGRGKAHGGGAGRTRAVCARKREAAERKEREEALQRKVDDAVARLFDTCCEWNVGSLKSHLKEVETLSNARAVNIRQPGSDGAAACGQTLLHACVRSRTRSDAEAIRNTFLLELLERGADPSLRDAFHRTVFQACADVGDLAMVRLLLNRRDALQKSLKPGHRRLAQLAISTQTGDNRWSALHYAAYSGEAEIIKELLAAGAQLNLKAASARHPVRPNDILVEENVSALELATFALELQDPNSDVGVRIKDAIRVLQEAEDGVRRARENAEVEKRMHAEQIAKRKQ